MRKFVSSILAALLLFLLLEPMETVQANPLPGFTTLPAQRTKIDSALNAKLKTLQNDEMITVIVQLRQRANLADGRNLKRGERLARVIDALKKTADITQGPVRLFLRLRKRQGALQNFTSLWIVNGFSITANATTINEIAGLPDVLSITPDTIDIVSVSSDATLNNPEPNISLITAPSLWNLGYTGQGIVVASMDSGVDMNHPELASRWRGGTNSWYDPFGQHPNTPIDLSGHGTWATGVMLAGDTGGTTVGVAPGAQWIAVKIFDDQGSSTATAIHLGYQWLLDPDNNPATSDAPQVVNNSWAYGSPGCNLEFEPDLQSLRAAGILPVFAAGNSGPSTNTSHSPANNPSAFAVGATNNNSLIYSLSSRGPSTCGGSTSVFPDVVAPGVNINTTDLGGYYTTTSGTSLSAPHVSGGLALLLSAYPNLTASQQENALLFTAIDRGVTGPDDIYGYGRIDLFAAYQWLATAPTETPVPSPTQTAEISATETPTTTSTVTPIGTNTPTNSPTFTLTTTQTLTPTITPTKTATALATSTATLIPTNTLTTIPTSTQTRTPTASATSTNTSTSVPTSTQTKTATASATLTATPVSTNTATIVPTSTQTRTPTASATITSTAIPTNTPTLASTPTSTKTATASATSTAIQVLTNTATIAPTSTQTRTPTASATFTPTKTPNSVSTFTPTSTPTRTPTVALPAFHIGDLDGTAIWIKPNATWKATVTIYVHNASEMPLSNVKVNLKWSSSDLITTTCTTNSSGYCSVSKNSSASVSSVTFTVTSAASPSYTYKAVVNHDPEGESTGTIITVFKP